MWTYNYTILPSDELEHHGIKGQRWGVRRYQNRDGTLNRRGMRKAAKMKEQYTLMTGKQLRRKPTKSSNSKPVSEMTDTQIRKKIERIRLENELNSLQPAKVSKGKMIIQQASKSLTNMAIERGTRMLGDYAEKNIRKKLGLSESDMKSASQKLADKAKDMENRWKIEQNSRNIERAKADAKAKQDSENLKKAQQQVNDYNNRQQQKQSEPYRMHGTNIPHSKESVNNSNSGSKEILRGTVENIRTENTNAGQQFISMLLEDKHAK